MNRETNRGNQGIDLRTLRVQKILDGESEDRQLIRTLQEQLSGAKKALKINESSIRAKDAEIGRLKAKLSARNPSEMPGDPEGYHRALGLHPAFKQELTEEQAKIVIKGIYKIYSKIFYPDMGGNLERMKKINVAYEAFLPKPKQETR